MKNKLWFILALVFLMTTLAVITARAEIISGDIQVKEMTVYINGQEFYHKGCTPSTTSPNATVLSWNCTENKVAQFASIERCENVDVKVVIVGADSVDNAIMRTWFRASGDTIEDETSEFDIFDNNQYTRTMYLKVPCTIDALKVYTMHIDVEADTTLKGAVSADIDFDVQRLANDISVKSINVRSSCDVSCSTLYVDAVIKNTGNHDLEDIYVKATVKELGVSGTAFIDLLVPYRVEDEDVSREVTIPIQLPSTIQTGTYTLELLAYNDDEETTESVQFTLAGGAAQPAVEIVPQTVKQEMTQGGSASYTMILTNHGSSTQVISIDAVGLDWATAQINPASFSLAPGESKLVTVYVTAKEDVVAAEHLFSVKVKYGQETKTINLVADVMKGKTQALDLKTILMIVGIVLAVAIIILLIVLLAQRSRPEEKAEESYY